MRRLAAPLPLSEAALEGRIIFLQHCAHCHDAVGQPTKQSMGPWLDRALVTARSEAAVRKQITTGSQRMPGFQYDLSPAQLDQLLEFLKSVSPDQKPKAS